MKASRKTDACDNSVQDIECPMLRKIIDIKKNKVNYLTSEIAFLDREIKQKTAAQQKCLKKQR